MNNARKSKEQHKAKGRQLQNKNQKREQAHRPLNLKNEITGNTKVINRFRVNIY